MEQSHLSASNDEVFRRLDTYPWDRDQEYQAGLSAIIGSVTDPIQIADLTLRARCFYLSRQSSVRVDFDAYKAHVEAIGTSGPLSTQDSSIKHEITSSVSPTNKAQSTLSAEPVATKNPKYPTTFAEIVQLITENKHIPGVKEIPPTVLHDQATQPTKNQRLKPWEKQISSESGTFGDRRDDSIQQDILK